jgi:hypothetical protein
MDSWQDSFDGGPARRKAATYAGQRKQRINADTHASSWIRSHDPNVGAAEGMKFSLLHQIWLLTEEFGMFGAKVSKRRVTYVKGQETGDGSMTQRM